MPHPSFNLILFDLPTQTILSEQNRSFSLVSGYFLPLHAVIIFLSTLFF
jgi:hypothetical protein